MSRKSTRVEIATVQRSRTSQAGHPPAPTASSTCWRHPSPHCLPCSARTKTRHGGTRPESSGIWPPPPERSQAPQKDFAREDRAFAHGGGFETDGVGRVFGAGGCLASHLRKLGPSANHTATMGAVSGRNSRVWPSSMQLTFMSPRTLITVRQRSRNQSTGSSRAMYSVGRPTA